MKLLGIDYGTKKVGIAVSNDDGTMAFPHDVFKNDEQFREKLLALIEEKDVETIVIGHSLDRSGAENVLQKKINDLMTDLTLETGLPVELEPEQYTSKEAERIQGKTAKTDASAAAIILNSYITKHASKDA